MGLGQPRFQPLPEGVRGGDLSRIGRRGLPLAGSTCQEEPKQGLSVQSGKKPLVIMRQEKGCKKNSCRRHRAICEHLFL